MGFIWRPPDLPLPTLIVSIQRERERVQDKERNGSRPNQSTSGCVLINHFSISHGPPFHHFNYSEQSSFVLLDSFSWNLTLLILFWLGKSKGHAWTKNVIHTWKKCINIKMWIFIEIHMRTVCSLSLLSYHTHAWNDMTLVIYYSLIFRVKSLSVTNLNLINQPLQSNRIYKYKRAL